MRIKIGAKIFIVLLIFFIEILLLMFTFSIINRHHEQIMHLQREEMEELDLVRNLQIALSRVVMPANDFLILGGAENEIQNFKILSQEVETLIDKLDNVTSDDIEERELLEHIKGEYLQVKDIAMKIFSLPDASGNPEAGRIMEEMDKVADDALKDAEEFRYFVQQEMEKAHIDMMKIKNAFDMVVWVGILSNIILIFGALFFLRRTIILPIKSMRNVMLEVGKGNLERKINLKNKDEIGDLAASFNKMTEDLRNIMGELRRDYQIQHAINSLFNFSLKDVAIDEVLKYAIDLPWLGFEPRGAIFLLEDESQTLVMKAQTRLSEPIKKLCAQVPFGKCLCGRAALTGEIQFADNLDARHEVTYPGIYPHGHYCVPIMFAGKIIGVMNMYTVAGHRRSKREEEYLRVIANVLAGIIVRKQAEEKLKNAYNELKTTQSQLIQAEKMQVVGRLASGVAHEVKNPLAIIFQGIDYLSGKVRSDDEGVGLTLKYMHGAVKRADSIVRGLLDFSSLSKLEINPENLNALIDKALSLVKYQTDKYRIQVARDLKEDIPEIKIDKNRIEQVLVNLILNAIQAMPEGGQLMVKTYTEEGLGKERWVVVKIDDTGPGIPEGVLGKIFDPFFTTKRNLGGTGLGLSVVRNVIEMHNGKIEIENRKDIHGVSATLMFKL